MFLINRLLNLMFPPRCVGCHRVGVFLCDQCVVRAPVVNSRTCLICERPSADGGRCYVCRNQPGPLTAATALCYYAPPIEDAIKRLKYNRGQALAPTLAALVTTSPRLPPWLRDDGATMLLPVPLHPARERERGFNQASLLTATLATHLGLPYDAHPTYLRRVRRTRPQVGLDHAQRQANVAGAFACDPHPAIRGKRIVLVDDVYTTGATMQDCARALREAGAARVYALAIARPYPGRSSKLLANQGSGK